MTGRHGDICACGHARHFHSLKLVAGCYRNDQCWSRGCYCAEFEHEPAQLRDARGQSAAASLAETAAPLITAAASESSPPAVSLPRAGTSSAHNENAGRAAHTAAPHGPQRR